MRYLYIFFLLLNYSLFAQNVPDTTDWFKFSRRDILGSKIDSLPFRSYEKLADYGVDQEQLLPVKVEYKFSEFFANDALKEFKSSNAYFNLDSNQNILAIILAYRQDEEIYSTLMDNYKPLNTVQFTLFGNNLYSSRYHFNNVNVILLKTADRKILILYDKDISSSILYFPVRQ